MPHLEPEHVGGITGVLASLATELVKRAPVIFRKLFPKKKKPAPAAAREPSPSAIVEAEFRGEIHEFKRAVLEELRVQRERYHGLRTLVTTLIGISEERRAARAAGRDFDTGVYEIDLREMARKLDAIPDAQLPQLSPPRPPLLGESNPRREDESDPE